MQTTFTVPPMTTPLRTPRCFSDKGMFTDFGQANGTPFTAARRTGVSRREDGSKSHDLEGLKCEM